jgi:hypothetical protein
LYQVKDRIVVVDFLLTRLSRHARALPLFG